MLYSNIIKDQFGRRYIVKTSLNNLVPNQLKAETFWNREFTQSFVRHLQVPCDFWLQVLNATHTVPALPLFNQKQLEQHICKLLLRGNILIYKIDTPNNIKTTIAKRAIKSVDNIKYLFEPASILLTNNTHKIKSFTKQKDADKFVEELALTSKELDALAEEISAVAPVVASPVSSSSTTGTSPNLTQSAELISNALITGRVVVEVDHTSSAPPSEQPELVEAEGPGNRPHELAPAANACPDDFNIDAPCKIIKANGDRVQMSASDQAGFSGGRFQWTTSSANIILHNANSATLTIESGATVSASRDAETIIVTRSAAGCADVVKTITVTVARLKFSKSTTQRYGYDDFDTPADSLDDHISIKKSDHTFLKVEIEGGALSTDFNFVCDDTSVCTPVAPAASAAFDLRLNAGAKNKAESTLHAKSKCSSAVSFSHIQVHVYKEKPVDVVVAKIYDSTQAGTNLNYATADYAAHTATVNNKLKEAVVKFNITNYDPANASTNVRYDLDGNGAVSYDISQGGGAELDAIKAAMTGTGSKIRVAIVRNMKSYYYLSAPAAVGDASITVTAGSVFNYPVGRSVALGTGAGQENVTIISSSGNNIALGGTLTKAHAVGDPLEYPAAGWSSDPILITESNSSLNTIEWTIPHEVGHRALTLADVVDTDNFMHWMQSWTDYRLRYCPRNKKHMAGTENQWELIPR